MSLQNWKKYSITGALVLIIGVFFTVTLTVNAEGIKVGDQAPDWTLPGTDGNEHSLSELLQNGPVVLAWFPKAYTSGCTMECKNLAEKGSLIQKFQVSYFMISADSVKDNKGFGVENGADFVLLSDTTTEVAQAYGVWNQRGYPNRHNIYIGTDGTILEIDTEVDVRTAAEDIAETLARLNVAQVTED